MTFFCHAFDNHIGGIICKKWIYVYRHQSQKLHISLRQALQNRINKSLYHKNGENSLQLSSDVKHKILSLNKLEPAKDLYLCFKCE